MRGEKYVAKEPCRKCGGVVRYVVGCHCVECMSGKDGSRREYMRAYGRKRWERIKKALAQTEPGPEGSLSGEN